jgi:hypothetical protein
MMFYCFSVRGRVMKKDDAEKERTRKDTTRRSDKVKSVVKVSYRTITYLKDIDIFDSRYWQFSAAAVS